MTENHIRRVVVMLPYERHFSTVIVVKRAITNGSAIGAEAVKSCCPATEIPSFLSHFDFPPSL
jgi:hypothetical protein